MEGQIGQITIPYAGRKYQVDTDATHIGISLTTAQFGQFKLPQTTDWQDKDWKYIQIISSHFFFQNPTEDNCGPIVFTSASVNTLTSGTRIVAPL